MGDLERASAAVDEAFAAAGVLAEPVGAPAVVPEQRRGSPHGTHTTS
jgi:hypothetical protein